MVVFTDRQFRIANVLNSGTRKCRRFSHEVHTTVAMSTSLFKHISRQFVVISVIGMGRTERDNCFCVPIARIARPSLEERRKERQREGGNL